MNIFIFDEVTMSIIIKLLVALILGVIVGTERAWAHKIAGMRTYALVSMGSALFIIISELISSQYLSLQGFDPIRMASQIVVGIGFIGTGLIFSKDSKVMGLTTATGLWVVAGIGMACGFGLFNVAIVATIFTLFVFIVLWFIEDQFKKTEFFKKEKDEDLNLN